MAIEDLLHPFVGRYLEAPGWLKATAGRAYAWVPPRMRLGRALDRFMHESSPNLSAEEAQRIATEKLENTLRWAIETVPAYAGFRGLLDGSHDPRDILA